MKCRKCAKFAKSEETKYYEKHRSPRRGRRGCRGAAGTPPARGAGAGAPSTAIGIPAPRAGQKLCASGGHSGRGAGGQTSGYRTEGKPPDTLTAKHRASRKKPRPQGATDVPTEGRAPKGACLMARRKDRRRSPTRATRRRREEHGRPQGAGVTPQGDGGRDNTDAGI